MTSRPGAAACPLDLVAEQVDVGGPAAEVAALHSRSARRSYAAPSRSAVIVTRVVRATGPVREPEEVEEAGVVVARERRHPTVAERGLELVFVATRDRVDLVQEQHGTSFGRWVPDGTSYADAIDDVVDRAGEALDVVGIDRREQRDAQLVTAELSVRFDVEDAVGAQRGGDRGGVDRVVEVDRRGHVAAGDRVGDERRGVRVRLGPAVDDPGRRVAPAGRELEAAVAEHPLELVVEQEDRGERRRVVGLVEARVLDRDRQVERGRHPAVASACSCSIRSIARGEQSASHRPPSLAKHFCGAK